MTDLVQITERMELECEAGCDGVDVVEAIVGDTRIVRVISWHRCAMERNDANGEYQAQYAYACGYHD